MRHAVLTLLSLAIGSGTAVAQPVIVRLGTHDGFGRVVFEFPHPVDFTTERVGDTIVVHFPGLGDIPTGSGTTRNVTGVVGGLDGATVAVAPGSRSRSVRLGNRVVVDVLDPAPLKRFQPQLSSSRAVAKSQRLSPPQVSPAASAPDPAVVAPITPVQSTAPTPSIEVKLPPSQPAVAAVSTPAPSTVPETLASAASLTASQDGLPKAAIMPFGPNVAAAAFRRGTEAWIVFDDRRPIDLAALADDPVFSGAKIELLPAATLLRVDLPVGQLIHLERRAEGWAAVATSAEAPSASVMPVSRPQRLLIPVTGPGQVVTVPDPETGRNLLVGTLRATGPGVPVAMRAPEFAILPSWQGMVVEPVSDRTVLRYVPDGFAIETGGELSAEPEGGAALAATSTLTRRFDFPADPVAVLLRRLQAQVQDIGEAPPQARREPRKAAAQTMLALGLGAEAQSLLRLAVEEDPRASADPDIGGLAGIAALMSGRPEEAAGLDAADLAGSDEVTLWRAVRSAMSKEVSAEAAPVFAATGGLVLSYPSALRNRLLPLIAETMAQGGMAQAADALLASMPDEPLLTFARAIRYEQKGDTASALALYDGIAAGRDRLASARAATRATMLRLASGALNPSQAAAALESQFLLWRGDQRERDLRMRTAEIQVQAEQWRGAIATLRETADLFPADKADIQAHITAVIANLLHGTGAASIAPLDLVSLADENASAVAQTDVAGLGMLLADKLVALDLPARAGPVLERMAAAASPGSDRAALGSRLAAMRLTEHDADGAATALTDTDAPGLPAALTEERGLLNARVHAQRGDVAGATAILSSIGTQAADELRATILSDSGDWHGAALALDSVAARTVPASGSLDPAQQDVLVRLASYYSRAADEVALRDLGRKQAGRLTGPRGDMFRLLTDAPVTGIGDLHRAASDIALARVLPSELNAMSAR